jgi:hypothetical protein
MAFHFRVPKPLHGWRSFLNELFVIVLGVLIALGFGEIAEDWNWRQKTEDGDARLRVELRNIFGHAAEQVIVQPCILAQLDGIRAHLADTGPRAAPLPLDDYPNNLAVLRLPTRPWSDAIWQALQQDGTATHFPRERQRYLGILYSQVETMRGLVMQSSDAAGRTLVTGYPGPLAPDMRTALTLTVAEQYRRSQYMTRIALQIMGTMRDIGYAPTDAEVRRLLMRTNISSNTIGFCTARGLPMADWKTELKAMPHLSRRPI